MAVAMANRGWLVERGEVHDGDHLVACHEHVVRPDVTVDELGRELAHARSSGLEVRQRRRDHACTSSGNPAATSQGSSATR
jgi:hypothetical protein